MPDKKPSEPKTLTQKLSEITGSIGRIPKNGYNSFHKYHYPLESDVVDHIRPLLAEHNIIIIPRVAHARDAALSDLDQTYPGWALSKDEELTSIVYEYDIIDGDSGEKLTTSSVGYGADRGDKGAYKCSTGAYKYMLLRLFMVSTGDDPERDEETDRRANSGSSSVRTSAGTVSAEVGGHTREATTTQIRQIQQASRSLGLGVLGMKVLIERVLGEELQLPDEEPAAAGVLTRYLDNLSSERVGKLLQALQETAETVEEADAEGSA